MKTERRTISEYECTSVPSSGWVLRHLGERTITGRSRSFGIVAFTRWSRSAASPFVAPRGWVAVGSCLAALGRVEALGREVPSYPQLGRSKRSARAQLERECNGCVGAHLDPIRILLLSLAGWVSRHQQDVIEYLVETRTCSADKPGEHEEGRWRCGGQSWRRCLVLGECRARRQGSGSNPGRPDPAA
jgi:hypothetical protein